MPHPSIFRYWRPCGKEAWVVRHWTVSYRGTWIRRILIKKNILMGIPSSAKVIRSCRSKITTNWSGRSWADITFPLIRAWVSLMEIWEESWRSMRQCLHFSWSLMTAGGSIIHFPGWRNWSCPMPLRSTSLRVVNIPQWSCRYSEVPECCLTVIFCIRESQEPGTVLRS